MNRHQPFRLSGQREEIQVELDLQSPGLPLGGVCNSMPDMSTLFGRSSDLQASY
jgi:hypothetical protein